MNIKPQINSDQRLNLRKRLRLLKSSSDFNQQATQGGFTLIELLTVLSIIGILSLLSVQSFQTYRKQASYSVANSTLREARTAVGGALIQPDIVYPAVNFESQALPGALTDPGLLELFPGLILSKNIKFTASYFPACNDVACTSVFVEVRPCSGEAYVNWLRYGDGSELLTERIAGVGCP